MASLPGIGRSTAGAILALSRGERFPILDGNVKRVLSRFFGVEGDLTERAASSGSGSSPSMHARRKVDVYTQAIMDLGATVCTRRKPLCATARRGVRRAARTDRQHEIPAPRKRAPARACASTSSCWSR